MTALFAPWILARQIGPRSSLPHALSFLTLCFASAFLCLPFLQETYLYEWDFLLAWLIAAAVYLPLQAACFSLVDPLGWNRPRQAFRFWFIAGCYTSAIMMTEIRYGPPRLRLDALLSLLRGDSPSWPIARISVPALIMALQLLLWAVALGACYAVRLRRCRISARVAWPAGLLATLAAIVLYAIVFQHVGERLYYLVELDDRMD